MLLLVRLAAATCTPIVDDDLTDYSADASVEGGRFDSSGWVAEGGSLVYNLSTSVPTGEMEILVRGLEESGVGQSDLAEMFSGTDGSFSDSAADQFLQLKFAGDVYDGYDGRIKLQLGMEYGLSGTSELAEWSDMRDWNSSDWHTLKATWGSGWSTLSVDGSVVAEVDYTEEAGGYIPFRSLRLPNNGSYTYDPLLSQLTFAHVKLCGEIADPPAITAFDIQPRELALGETLDLHWTVSGTVSEVVACGRSGDTELCSGSLGSTSGSASVPSDSLGPGTWTTWLQATGDGTATSTTVDIIVHEAGWTDDGSDPVDTGSGSSGTDDPPDEEPPAADTGEAGDVSTVPKRPPGEATATSALGCGLTSPSAAWALALLALRRRR